MVGIVLAEDHIQEFALIVHDGQGIELVVPNDVVGLFEGGTLGGGHQLFQGRHEFPDLQLRRHAADAVVAAGHNAQKLAVGGAVLRDGHGGVARLGFQFQHVGQGVLRRQVAVADHEAGLVGLDPGDHSRLLLDGLGAVNKGNAALLGQGDGHGIVGHRLHNGGHQRDIQADGALFAFAELHQRGLQADAVRDALCAGITGDQEIFAEGMGRFFKKLCHNFCLLYQIHRRFMNVYFTAFQHAI